MVLTEASLATPQQRGAGFARGPITPKSRSPVKRSTAAAPRLIYSKAPMTLMEAAAQADELAQAGSERELANLRQQWDEEVESAARSGDYRERAVAYRAIGQFRFRQKVELLRRGLEDDSPAVRGSALVSVAALSKTSPGLVNSMRPLLHTLASTDSNQAVRRLAIVCLRHGSPQRETIVLLSGLAEQDDEDAELRNSARTVAADLKKRAAARGHGTA